MCRILKHIIWLVLVSLSSCTDLAAVYKHDILLIRDVDKITPKSPLKWESLILPLPKNLVYPVGLTHDPQTNRLFVADALHKDTKIFSLSLDSDYKVEAMYSVVKNSSVKMMEDLSYDPRSRQLYWTDSFSHGVFKISIPNELKDDDVLEPQLVHGFSSFIESRGIAVDYCNEQLYWTKRDGTGKVPSSVEMLDLKGNVHQVVRQDREMNFYYQGLTYDIPWGTLVWAETLGDDFNKSDCHFISLASGMKEHQEILSYENCFPFSLATDEEYVYWADWGQQGIMRASLIDPTSVTKLVHTPSTASESAVHHGAYGLALLNDLTKESFLDLCKDMASFKKQVGNVKVQELEERFPTEHSDIKSSTERNNEDDRLNLDSIVSSMNTVENDMEIYADDYVEKNQSKLVEIGTGIEAPLSSSTMVHTNKLMVNAEICNRNQLLMVIVALSVFCALFMSSTIFLLVKVSCRNSQDCKSALSIAVDPKQAVPAPAQITRQVKRFGPKKRYGSGNKSGINGTSQCSGLSAVDGVSINIEDCCQMTMCETPCYTSVKREGKGYKIDSNMRCEDKRSLLQDCEDI